jgi:hypothetical protein
MVRRKFLKSLAALGSTLFLPLEALAATNASRVITAWTALKSPVAYIAGLRRIADLRRSVARLPVCEEYRAALFKSIVLYRDQIISRPVYAPEEGMDDLEALQQVTLGDRVDQFLRERGL